MTKENLQLLLGAIDTLGCALADEEHNWTSGETAIYEAAVDLLNEQLGHAPELVEKAELDDHSKVPVISADDLNRLAKHVHVRLPEEMGFILLIMAQNREDAIAQYVSNFEREGAIVVLKQTLFRWGLDEEWMTKIH